MSRKGQLDFLTGIGSIADRVGNAFEFIVNFLRRVSEVTGVGPLAFLIGMLFATLILGVFVIGLPVPMDIGIIIGMALVGGWLTWMITKSTTSAGDYIAITAMFAIAIRLIFPGGIITETLFGLFTPTLTKVILAFIFQAWILAQVYNENIFKLSPKILAGRTGQYLITIFAVSLMYGLMLEVPIWDFYIAITGLMP